MCETEDINITGAVDTKIRTIYYLVDYENVRHSGFTGMEKLTTNAKLVIFYTAKSDSMPFTLFNALSETKAELIFYEVECGGQNALDFQLSSYLGYILGTEPDADCHIISGDKGFEFVRSFWKHKGKKVKLTINIAGDVQQNEQKTTQKVTPQPVLVTSEFDIAVKPLNLSQSDKDKLKNIFNSHKTGSLPKRKQAISSEIGKVFGNDKIKNYYKAVKPLIK